MVTLFYLLPLLQGNTSSDRQLEIANAIDALKGQIFSVHPYAWRNMRIYENKILRNIPVALIGLLLASSNPLQIPADQPAYADVIVERNPIEVSPKEKLALLAEKYENTTTLSDTELIEVLSLVGFTGQSLKIAWAVSKAESNGRPLAFNGNHKTGDSSYGIFQINMIGDNGPARRDKFDLSANSDLFNPIKNAKIAYHMSNGGENWSAWSAYRSGAYKLRLKDFPKE